MDDDVAAAITAAELPPGTANTWFTLVTAAHRKLVDSGAGEDREHYGRLLTTIAADHFVDPAVPAAFLARAATMDLVRRVCALGAELPLRYQDLCRAAAAGPPADEDTRQADPWQRLLARHAAGWSAWDGSDEGWARFRDWFYTVANGFDADAYAEAYHRLQPLDAAPAADRISQLRAWGFPITAQPPADPEPAPPARRSLLRRRTHRR